MLLRALDAQGTISAKRKVFPDEKLVREVADELIGKGLLRRWKLRRKTKSRGQLQFADKLLSQLSRKRLASRPRRALYLARRGEILLYFSLPTSKNQLSCHDLHPASHGAALPFPSGGRSE